MAYRHCGNQQGHSAHDWSPHQGGVDFRCTGTKTNPTHTHWDPADPNPDEPMSGVDAYIAGIKAFAKARGDEVVQEIHDRPGDTILGIETANGMGISIGVNFTP